MFTTKLSICRNLLNAGKRINYDYFSAVACTKLNGIRFKHSVANKGVKGNSTKKFPKLETQQQQQNEMVLDEFMEEDEHKHALLNDKDYDLIANQSMHVVTKKILNEQSVLLIQPYIKWGPRKSIIKPELQIEEAESLIRTIPNWKVECSLKVSVDSMEKKMLFGTGKLDELKQLISDLMSQGKMITCMFISKSTLSYMQKTNLEDFFHLPVMDRYSVVIQILRLHATSTEAKLQVAMAEIPYIWQQMRDLEMLGGIHQKKQKYYITDSQEQMLKLRERKLKHELQHIRQHRELLRHKRKQKNFPIIAVVGYTNSGKTSLIKALTHEAKLQPKNELFATLDVTAHAGLLPSKLEVIYMDTVGFMSDLPTGLIECFVATLEDALGADLIIHVTDISHECFEEQKNHVETTLASLIRNNTEQRDHIMENIVTVANKADLVDSGSLKLPDDVNLISSTTGEGIEDLMTHVEKRLLELTGRKKITMRVPMGGEEMQWLYKNSAVTDSEADPEDNQKILLHVVISNAKLQQFKHHFLLQSN